MEGLNFSILMDHSFTENRLCLPCARYSKFCPLEANLLEGETQNKQVSRITPEIMQATKRMRVELETTERGPARPL